MSYNPQQHGVDLLLSEIFLFSPEVEKRIDRLKFGARSTPLSLASKKRHMVAYLAELAYDIAICAADNVSNSGGFESCGLWQSN